MVRLSVVRLWRVWSGAATGYDAAAHLPQDRAVPRHSLPSSRVLSAAVLVALLLPVSIAGGTVPMSTFPKCGEKDRPDLCPADLGTDWDLISYIPQSARKTVRESERALGSGSGLDRALRTTAGRFDVIVAIGDSGIDWSDDNLRNKFFLNTAELPLPQGADGVESATYDFDGNGLVNIVDYEADPRVDWNAGPDGWADVLDVSDLIYTFSDGVDDDGNGYTDDISGWDFFDDDNDAFHRLESDYGEHGNGVATEAAAEGDGGGGHIGMCPNCAVLPVRVGDTFVTDGTRSAEGIVYATDMGAVSISQAVGAMSSPDSTRAAVAYAFDQGTVVVGAAGDENQYHHNYPAVLDNVLYVKAVRFDGPGDQGAYTFMTAINCNNYGPRLVLSASSPACATGATAKTTGLVGLVQSAALDSLGERLKPGEVEQVLIASATDIAFTEDERATFNGYPAGPGWDLFYGYGRINAAAAVEAVAAGRIPPIVSIDSPAWFQTVDPLTVGQVEITARISADRSSGYDWVLEAGRGDDPQTWETVASGSATTPTDGVIATLDIASLPEIAVPEAPDDETVVARMERVHGPAVTLRLTATDAKGLVGLQRKLFHVSPDPDLKPGFPLALSGSAEASPVLVDLDDDDVFEVVVASSSGDVLALYGDGTALPGWPVSTAVLDRPWSNVATAYTTGGVPAPRASIIASPAAGDVDGDGMADVVVATMEGTIWAWHADGTLLSGFPYQNIGRESDEFDANHSYDQGFMAAPVLADLDGDGDNEIIAAGMDSRLYVVDGDGSDWGPYPIEVCAPELCGNYGFRIIASPTVGDIDGDGDLDILQGTNEGAKDGTRVVTHLFDATTGQSWDGWPRLSYGLIAEALLLPMIGEGHPASPALADLDMDGTLEIFDPIMLGQTGIIDGAGDTVLDLSYLEGDFGPGQNTANVPSLLQMASNPAFGDMDGDGVPDPVIGGTSSLWVASLAASFWMDAQHGVAAWSGATGDYLPGWPRQIEDLQFLMAPVIADITGDGRPEVIYGSAGHLMYAWDVDGNLADGWPKLTGQWILGSPAVGDIDGDGLVDVVVTTRAGIVWAWSTQGRADQVVQWQSEFHDARNTGNYEVALPVQAGPVDSDSPGSSDCGGRAGCGCGGASADSGPGTGSTALLLLLPLGLWGLRRRYPAG
ncbi:MAG: S8 family serine peptidase [Oligoflexia bacterium]|nr:S8 family serine peptidase [Oligoflexia bacterium]